jgi:invasion protein IalB
MVEVFGGSRRRGIAIVASMCAALSIYGLAFAQSEKPAPKRAEPAVKGEPTPATKSDSAANSDDPQTTTASYGDWVVRCQRMAIEGETRRLCEVDQTIQNGQNSPFAQLAISRLRKSEPLKLTLALPVNVGFPSAPKVSLEGKDGESLALSWRRCIPAGCIADAALSEEVLSTWRAAKTQGQVESKNSQGQEFKFAISFRGLGPALEALAKEP